jgi:Zn-dependent protease
MLAVGNYSNPLLWAVVIGWILTVVLHEFAHGLIADLGGDYTVRQRGGLTLNPLHYIHPVTSILLPALFVLMGGIPLPGGATYIRTDLLRNRYWKSAVSFAGPMTNFLIFLALALPFHPWFHWIHLDRDPEQWTNLQVFMGASAFLQLFSVLLNLLPFPPLDGFGVIAPFLPPELRRTVQTPKVFLIGIIVLFFLILTPAAQHLLGECMFGCLKHMRFDANSQDFFAESFDRVFFSPAG